MIILQYHGSRKGLIFLLLKGAVTPSFVQLELRLAQFLNALSALPGEAGTIPPVVDFTVESRLSARHRRSLGTVAPRGIVKVPRVSEARGVQRARRFFGRERCGLTFPQRTSLIRGLYRCSAAVETWHVGSRV